jgi:hypothetical protein
MTCVAASSSPTPAAAPHTIPSLRAQYKYLDPLLVTDTSLSDFGGLYLQSIAGVKGMDTWRDPSMHFPQDRSARSLLKKGVGLYALVGPSEAWEVGRPIVKLDGSLVLVMNELDLKKRKLVLELSVAGFCGGRPHTVQLSISWDGPRKHPEWLQVKKLSERLWTTEDRIAHKRKTGKANKKAGFFGKLASSEHSALVGSMRRHEKKSNQHAFEKKSNENAPARKVGNKRAARSAVSL